MDFKEVCAFFGGTIFYEELRGDFEALRSKIEQDYGNSIDSYSEEAAAGILLRSILSFLTGDFYLGVQGLGPMMEGWYGERWTLRAFSYMLFQLTLRAYPPLFRSRPQISGPSGIILEVEFCAEKRASVYVGNCVPRLKDATELDELEFSVFLFLWLFSSKGLEAARLKSPTYHSSYGGQTGPSEETADANPDVKFPEVLYEQLERKLLPRSRNLGLSAVETYLLRLLYELQHAQGISEASETLQTICMGYEKTRDSVGRGLCYILEGDGICSAPFTSLLTLNLPLIETWALGPCHMSEGLLPDFIRGDLNTESSDHEDPDTAHSSQTKARGKLQPHLFVEEKSLDLALQHYERAEEVFVKAGCLRGQGAVKLRKGCLLLMKAMNNLIPAKFDMSLELPRQLFSEAVDFFEKSGDSLHYCLSSMMKLLTGNLTKEQFNEGLKIGGFASIKRSGIFMQHLSLLAYKFADFCRYRRGVYSWSAKAYEWAIQILQASVNSPLSDTRSSSRVLLISALLAQIDTSFYVGPVNALGCSYKMEDHIQVFCRELLEFAKSDRGVFSDRCSWLLQQYASEYSDLLYRIGAGLGTFSARLQERLNFVIDILCRIPKGDEGLNHGSTFRDYVRFRIDCIHWKSREKLLLAQQGRAAASMIFPEYFSQVEREGWLLREDLGSQIFEDIAGDLLDFRHPESATFIASIKPYAFDQPASIPHFIPNHLWYDEGNFISILESRLELALKANAWDLAVTLFQALDAAMNDYTDVQCISKQWQWRRFLWAALVESHLGNTDDAFSFVAKGIHLVCQSRRFEIGVSNDKSAFFAHPDIPRLFNLAAKILIQAYDTNLDLSGLKREYYHMYAVWYLERGKAISALELASVNELDKKRVEEWIESSHRWAVLAELRQLSRPLTKIEQEELESLNAEYETLKWSRWRMPIGNVEELTVWPPTTLFHVIPDDSLVIYANASQDGTAVFCIHADGVLDAKFNESATGDILSSTVYAFISRLRLEHQDADLNDLMNSVILPLSTLLLEPFEGHIKSKKHIIFVPTASLSQFPVGTLIFPMPEDCDDQLTLNGDEYLGVQKAVSQVPSLSFYHYLRSRDVNKPKQLTTSVIARPGSLRGEMLGGEAALPLAGIEALFISTLTNTPVLRAEQQTKAAFLNQLEEHGVIHIATHGYLDHEAPLLSRISLGEDTRVVDMMRARTKASLVIFSACNTAAGIPGSSDDVVGFPYAVLAAGANAFLGSLWAANDLATLVHMFHFYTLQRLMNRAETLAYTWFRATRMLFYSTTDEVAKILQTLADMWDTWEADGIHPETIVRRGKKQIQAAIKSLRSIDGKPMINWKHPYTWAAFMMVGNGDIDRALTEWQKEHLRLREAAKKAGEELTTESESKILEELERMNLSTTTVGGTSGS